LAAQFAPANCSGTDAASLIPPGEEGRAANLASKGGAAERQFSSSMIKVKSFFRYELFFSAPKISICLMIPHSFLISAIRAWPAPIPYLLRVHIVLYLHMIFEWDEAKNETNQRKHGLSFEIARAVFSDPLAVIRMDPGAHKEERWQIIGKVNETLIVLVVYIDCDENAGIYRLITARRVTAHERKAYEAG
jgi:uncharacterized DUF497 family protein